MLYMQGSEDHYYVDVKDEIVRGSMVLNDGKLCWPPNPPIPMAAPQYNNGQNGIFEILDIFNLGARNPNAIQNRNTVGARNRNTQNQMAFKIRTLMGRFLNRMFGTIAIHRYRHLWN